MSLWPKKLLRELKGERIYGKYKEDCNKDSG